MTTGRPPARPLVAALAFGAVLWVVVLIAAPVAAGREPADPAFRVAGAVYLFGRTICHQRPERSFHLNGVQLPVCARCLGLYAGAAAGAVLAWKRTRSDGSLGAGTGQRADGRGGWDTRLVLGAAALPTLLTAIVELTGLSAVAGSVRFAAALPLGACAAWLVAVAATGTHGRTRAASGRV